MPFLAAITVLIETYWNVKKETKVCCGQAFL